MEGLKTYKYAVAMPDGKISWVTTGPYIYLPCDDSVTDETHYVDVNKLEILPKKDFSLDYQVDGMEVVFTGLPSGLKLSTNGMSGVTDDTDLIISYDVPGSYLVEFRGNTEYLDQVVEVTVGDP